MMITALVTAVPAKPPAAEGTIAWPAPPAEARVEYVGVVDCKDLRFDAGFFGKLKRIIAGRSDRDLVGLPFDIVVSGGSIFLTCRDLPALVEIDRKKLTYKLHESPDIPCVSPVALCDRDGVVYVSDSGAATVYRYTGKGELQPFIAEGLVRPTGIAWEEDGERFYVVDTGDHSVKVFDRDGSAVDTIGGVNSPVRFHFPTFAAVAAGGDLLVNDALNYSIRRFDSGGKVVGAFGREGDGPGSFARPKGIALDSDDHVYVVDNLFDNIQVFDRDGRLLVVIGARGQRRGEFWSPGGIDIVDDTIYVADTFNNRIQVLHYMGGGS